MEAVPRIAPELLKTFHTDAAVRPFLRLLGKIWHEVFERLKDCSHQYAESVSVLLGFREGFEGLSREKTEELREAFLHDLEVVNLLDLLRVSPGNIWDVDVEASGANPSMIRNDSR